jgi:hypothetical protein
MTDYDRGDFVEGRTITINPAANGTFVVLRGEDETDAIGFSSATDMLGFLQSEYGQDDGKGYPSAPSFADHIYKTASQSEREAGRAKNTHIRSFDEISEGEKSAIASQLRGSSTIGDLMIEYNVTRLAIQRIIENEKII